MGQERNRKLREEQREAPQEQKKKPGLGELFDIPKAAFSGVMQIELSGNTEAVVDGCTGILEYDENIIKLAGGKMGVKFTGRNLQIKVLTHDSAIIEGFIIGVEFII